jgi:hypothetical protein
MHATANAFWFCAGKAFSDRINAHPCQILTRLWPRFGLDLDYGKLLVSN